MKRIGVALVVLVSLVLTGQAVAVTGPSGVAAAAAMPAVGKLKARDKTSGEPVTTFKRSTRLYNVADGFNKGLDRDNDGIACEKK